MSKSLSQGRGKVAGPELGGRVMELLSDSGIFVGTNLSKSPRAYAKAVYRDVQRMIERNELHSYASK